VKTEILSGLTTALHAVARAQKIEEGQPPLPLELGRCKNPPDQKKKSLIKVSDFILL